MSEPVTVFDVAQYILDKVGPLSTWKLQKLCYYAQAWSMVWESAPLFKERIEAWANGPVIPDLYEKHRGMFEVSSVGGDPTKLSKVQVETIDAILATYGDKTPYWLSELTHIERPWLDARKRDGLAPGERGTAEIVWDDLVDYYGGL